MPRSLQRASIRCIVSLQPEIVRCRVVLAAAACIVGTYSDAKGGPGGGPGDGGMACSDCLYAPAIAGVDYVSPADPDAASALRDCGTSGGGVPFFFSPDHRPGVIIGLVGGNACTNWDEDNPFRFKRDFDFTMPDTNPALYLHDELDEAWAQGFRRIMLWLPGGNIQDPPDSSGGHSLIGFSVFDALPQQYRDLWHGPLLTSWIFQHKAADPNFELVMYTGSWINEPCTPCLHPDGGFSDCDGVILDNYDCSHVNTSNSRYMNPENAVDAELLCGLLTPWLDIGFNSVYFDAAAIPDDRKYGSTVPRNAFVKQQFNPDYSGIKFGGEALPWDDWPNYELDYEALWVAPWIVIQKTFERRKDTSPDPDPAVDALNLYDPSTLPNIDDVGREIADVWDGDCVEVGIWHRENDFPNSDVPLVSLDRLRSYRDRGFISWATRPKSRRIVARLYDYPELFTWVVSTPCSTADFDGDGDVDCDDRFDFLVTWASNQFTAWSSAAFADGDIDDDDDVDADDYDAYATAWMDTMGAGGTFEMPNTSCDPVTCN